MYMYIPVSVCLCNCSLQGQLRFAGLFLENLLRRGRLAVRMPLLNADLMHRLVTNLEMNIFEWAIMRAHGQIWQWCSMLLAVD